MDLLQWLATEIANARVPKEIEPLLTDAEIIGLMKQSNMAKDIDAQEKAAAAEKCQACSNVGCEECGYCRPPALWAGELPTDRLSSTKQPPEPDEAARAMAERMTTAPHSRLACGCDKCRECAAAAALLTPHTALLPCAE